MIRITNPKKFIIAVIVSLLFILLGAGRLMWGSARIAHEGEIVVNPGSSAAAVWDRAVERGFTSRALPWKWYGWWLDAGGAIQAGVYELREGEHVRDVIRRMVSGDISSQDIGVTYPEGFTLRQVAERTAARGIGTADEFVAAAVPETVADTVSFAADLPDGRDLEGYLFPDTYRIHPDDTVADVINRMAATFDLRVTDDMRSDIVDSGKTLDDIVIMASIIEREVQLPEDMALVSGVLWNRIESGEGLYADATIRYALGKWDGVLTVEDLQVDSPYNTRRYAGLPPGPISNPGLAAIRSAINPTPSGYYYYLSAPDGTTIFAATNDEHNANKAKYLR